MFGSVVPFASIFEDIYDRYVNIIIHSTGQTNTKTPFDLWKQQNPHKDFLTSAGSLLSFSLCPYSLPPPGFVFGPATASCWFPAVGTTFGISTGLVFRNMSSIGMAQMAGGGGNVTVTKSSSWPSYGISAFPSTLDVCPISSFAVACFGWMSFWFGGFGLSSRIADMSPHCDSVGFTGKV